MFKQLFSFGLILLLAGCGSPANQEDYEKATTGATAQNNYLPVAKDDTITLLENTDIDIYPLENDSDFDTHDTLTIAKSRGAEHGQIEVLGTYIRYIPQTNFTGLDSIYYTITDGKDESTEALIKIYVTPQKDLYTPIGVEDSIYLDENTKVTIDVLANDKLLNPEENQKTLTIVDLTSPQHGTVVIENDKVLYTPHQNYRGNDSFTYRPSYDGYDGNITHVDIRVNAVNQAPIGFEDSVTTNENIQRVIDVLANDTDIDGDRIFIDKVSQPFHGETYVEDDRVIYIPNAFYVGDDNFTYVPHDGELSAQSVIVKVKVKDVNYPPIAQSDSFSVTSHRAIELDVLENDINHDQDSVTIKSVTTPAHGEAFITDNGVIEYISALGYIGKDSFSYVSTDGINDSNATLVSITVTELGANQAPIALNDSATIAMNAQNSFIDVLKNDSDEDGDIISIYSLTQPQHGTVISVEGGLEYTPNRDFVGDDSFTYTLSDGKTSGTEATVSIEVTNENIAPVGVDDDVQLYQNSSITIDVLANDIDQNSDPLTIKIISDTENGILELREGKLFYQPNQGFLGRDSFTYRPNDGKEDGNITTVDIWVISQDNLAIQGKVSFDRVPVSNSGLDYDNIRQEVSRGVVVELLNGSHRTISQTTTDSDGNYRFDNLQEGKEYKIRIYAQLKSKQWDVKVVDNTQSKANYVMEGNLVALNENTTTRDFNAKSGWSSNQGYIEERVAAPFAILDSVYDALLKIQAVDANRTLNALLINWSPQNTSTSGDKNIGYIATSHFDQYNEQLWLLGDDDVDTDEYDVSVVTHEFGHYLKSQVSRQDSIGGNHNISSNLDPRVAYEEGWCNAFAGIVHNDPIYIDTTGPQQSYSNSFDLEDNRQIQGGWYSEGSVHRIIYDLFDTTNEGADQLSLGFDALYKVASSIETQYPAFLTILTLGYGLKTEYPNSANAIDSIMASENIDAIIDYYGSNQSYDGGDSDALPIYKEIALNESKTFCTETKFGLTNRLLNRILIKVDIPTSDDYAIKVTQVASANGATLDGDPDFEIYSTDPHKRVGYASSNSNKSEEESFDLNRGLHLIDLYDSQNANKSCFSVYIEEDDNAFKNFIDSIFDIFSNNNNTKESK